MWCRLVKTLQHPITQVQARSNQESKSMAKDALIMCKSWTVICRVVKAMAMLQTSKLIIPTLMLWGKHRFTRTTRPEIGWMLALSTCRLPLPPEFPGTLKCMDTDCSAIPVYFPMRLTTGKWIAVARIFRRNSSSKGAKITGTTFSLEASLWTIIAQQGSKALTLLLCHRTRMEITSTQGQVFLRQQVTLTRNST